MGGHRRNVKSALPTRLVVRRRLLLMRKMKKTNYRQRQIEIGGRKASHPSTQGARKRARVPRARDASSQSAMCDRIADCSSMSSLPRFTKTLWDLSRGGRRGGRSREGVVLTSAAIEPPLKGQSVPSSAITPDLFGWSPLQSLDHTSHLSGGFEGHDPARFHIGPPEVYAWQS